MDASTLVHVASQNSSNFSGKWCRYILILWRESRYFLPKTGESSHGHPFHIDDWKGNPLIGKVDRASTVFGINTLVSLCNCS